MDNTKTSKTNKQCGTNKNTKRLFSPKQGNCQKISGKEDNKRKLENIIYTFNETKV